MSVTAYGFLPLSSRLPENPTAVLKKTYRIKIEDGMDGWLVVTCLDLPGVVTQGKTEDEAIRNALEAIALMLEGTPDENKEFNLLII